VIKSIGVFSATLARLSEQPPLLSFLGYGAKQLLCRSINFRGIKCSAEQIEAGVRCADWLQCSLEFLCKTLYVLL